MRNVQVLGVVLLIAFSLGCREVRVDNPVGPDTGGPPLDLSPLLGDWKLLSFHGQPQRPTGPSVFISKGADGRVRVRLDSANPGKSPPLVQELVGARLRSDYVVSMEDAKLRPAEPSSFDVMKVSITANGSQMFVYLTAADAFRAAVASGALAGEIRTGEVGPDSMYVRVTGSAQAVRAFLLRNSDAFQATVIASLEKVR